MLHTKIADVRHMFVLIIAGNKNSIPNIALSLFHLQDSPRIWAALLITLQEKYLSFLLNLLYMIEMDWNT